MTQQLPQTNRNESSKTFLEDDAIRYEREQLNRFRGKPAAYWTGIGLSGGGIRAATFCLGALQRLAKARVLEQIDYLSSVSGGGYTACALQWWWHYDSNTDGGDKFPYGGTLKGDNPRLKFLRAHGSYLTPGDGITFWSGAAVVLRTIFLNMIVWFPLLVFVEVVLLKGSRWASNSGYQLIGFDKWCASGSSSKLCANLDWLREFALGLLGVLPEEFSTGAYPVVFTGFIMFAGVALLSVVLLAIVLAWTSILIPPETNDTQNQKLTRALVCAIVGVLLFVVAQYVKSELHGMTQLAVEMSAKVEYVLAYVILPLSIWALVIAVLQLTGKLKIGLNYRLRRWFDSHAGTVIVLAAMFIILGLIPYATDHLMDAASKYERTATLAGFASLLGGVISGLYGHFVQAQRLAPNLAARWAATIASAVFLYSLTLSAYVFAEIVVDNAPHILFIFPKISTEYVRIAIWCSIVFAVFFGWLTNLNHLGLHRFYRDRLMEAFMPSMDALSNKSSKFSEAEGTTLTDIWPLNSVAGSRLGRPYPLINTNVILVNDSNSKYRVRGGDNFILSPLLIGSRATGWQKTVDHIKEHGPFTLPSAMAASGAAANANAAYVGSGITRDRLISIVMMLLNMRLGIWVGAPGIRSGTPNHFLPALGYGLLRCGYKTKSRFVELTDGGHFDNLGIYELVRRRVSVMIVFDAEEDPKIAMTALVSVCQRVSEDFGVEIEIGDAADIFYPKDRPGYPVGAKFADSPFFYAPINYDGVSKGALVYAKANMIKKLGFTAKGYKAINSDFPNQPTADQFFDAAQFEAYRELGYLSAEAIVDDLGLDGKTQIRDAVFNKLNIKLPPTTPMMTPNAIAGGISPIS